TQDFSAGKTAFANLCGPDESLGSLAVEIAFSNFCSDDKPEGYLANCRQKLIQFDNETQILIEEANLDSRVADLNRRMLPFIMEKNPALLCNAILDNIDNKYAEYMTGNAAVDEEIKNLFEAYGDDLSGLDSDSGLYWNDFSENQKKALARIYDVSTEYAEGHLSTEKSKKYLTHIENILRLTLTSPRDSNEKYLFNSDYLAELKKYSSSEQGKQYTEELKDIEMDKVCYGASFEQNISIELDGVGIIFSLSDKDKKNGKEFLCHTDEKRTKDCMEYWERINPGCYDYTRLLMTDDEIVETYNCTETSADVELIDNLMKTDGSYANVFNVDPEGLSATAEYNIAAYGANMSMNALYNEDSKDVDYCKAYNNFLSQMASADYGQGGVKENEYLTKYAVASKYYRQAVVDGALAIPAGDLSYEEEKDLANIIDGASFNELYAFSLYRYGLYSDDKVSRISVDLEYENQNQISVKEYDKNGKQLALEEYEISSYSGYAAENSIEGCQLYDLQEEEEKLAEEFGVNSAIAVVSIFSDKIGTALSGIANVCMNSGSDAISDISDLASEKAPYAASGLSLLSVLVEYEEGMLEISEKKDKIFNEINAQLFYNAGAFNVGNESGAYYVGITDPNKVNMIRDWNANGIEVLDDRIKENEIIKSGIIDHLLKVDVLTNNYTHEEITKAVNTLVYGANGDNTYESILEVPKDILIYFTNEMNAYISEKIEKGQSLAEFAQDYEGEYDND
uniref:hypothetical protein n=1 Tax=Pseudobutyrivibrio sp. MD2005 TaxID=1410616 RepID=UPI000568B02E